MVDLATSNNLQYLLHELYRNGIAFSTYTRLTLLCLPCADSVASSKKQRSISGFDPDVIVLSTDRFQQGCEKSRAIRQVRDGDRGPFFMDKWIWRLGTKRGSDPYFLESSPTCNYVIDLCSIPIH